MTSKPAHDLHTGDVFRMHIYGEVIAVTPVAGGMRVKVRIELEDQGHRSNSGMSFADGGSSLEFTDAGHVLEFLCRPSRKFHVVDDNWDDDGDGSDADAPPPQTPVALD